MKATGGFEYYLNNIKLSGFDEFENKIKNIEVKINVDNLKIYAVTV